MMNFFRKSKYPFTSPICRYEAISNACAYNENTGYETFIRTSETHAQAYFADGDEKIPLVRKNGFITPGKWSESLRGKTIDWPLSYFIDKIHFEQRNLVKILSNDYIEGKTK